MKHFRDTFRVEPIVIRSVREWTHSPDKGSWGKELRDAEALFLCKKICYNGKNQLEAGHCSPTAQRRLVCVKTENFVNFFKSCPVQSETLAAFRRRRNAFIIRRIFGSLEPFCKRKGFQELITSTDYPRKVPSGKFSVVETPVL